MLPLENFIKSLPRDSHFERGPYKDTLLLGKYKSYEETLAIQQRLQPTSLTIQGLTVHHASGIFEYCSHYYSYPYILLASKKGLQLLKEDPNFFFKSEQNPAHIPGAEEVTGNFHSKVYRVPYPPLNKTLYIKIAQQTGHEPFETIGMKLLEKDFHIPDHLITTQSRLITEQAEGIELTQIQFDPEIEELVQERMKLFRNLVNKTIAILTQKGPWSLYDGSGIVSSLLNKDHFYIRNWNSFLYGNIEDLKKSVEIVDGVTHQTNDINCRFAH